MRVIVIVAFPPADSATEYVLELNCTAGSADGSVIVNTAVDGEPKVAPTGDDNVKFTVSPDPPSSPEPSSDGVTVNVWLAELAAGNVNVPLLAV